VNGKGETATVTWYGCRRGDSFEGYEPRCGDRRKTRCPGKPGLRRLKTRETQRTPGSAAGCNRPATPSSKHENVSLLANRAYERERRKPSRWCKTTRTERVRGWSPRTEADGSFSNDAPAGVDAPEHVDGEDCQASRAQALDAVVPDPACRTRDSSRRTARPDQPARRG